MAAKVAWPCGHACVSWTRTGACLAIVNTVREPLLVLDENMRVVAASRSFYLTFRVERQKVEGVAVYALGDGQWNIRNSAVAGEDTAAGNGDGRLRSRA